MQGISATATAGNSTWAEIPPSIRQRLAGYDVHTAADWRQLSRPRKEQLFGVTREMRQQLDQAARGVRP
jgi:hypothetical protein